MANIYDIDFNQQSPELLPPDKRDNNTIALFKSLLKPIQWCRDLILGSYKNGSIADTYSAGNYNEFDQVIYNKSVYYSLENNNTALPSDNNFWLKIQENFLGSSERVKFNGQNIVLEYALNKRFSGVFRPAPSVTRSDIYMEILPFTVAGFNVGQSAGSSVGQNYSVDKVGSSTPFIKIYNFDVKIKSIIFATTNNQEITDFINLYIPASFRFTITPY